MQPIPFSCYQVNAGLIVDDEHTFAQRFISKNCHVGFAAFYGPNVSAHFLNHILQACPNWVVVRHTHFLDARQIDGR